MFYKCAICGEKAWCDHITKSYTVDGKTGCCYECYTKGEEGEKHDEGKLRLDLIPTLPIKELALVYGMGAKKYGKDNWKKGLKYSRIYAAMLRHLVAWIEGEDVDEESGYNHLAHVAWGCFTLICYTEGDYSEFDDRCKY